jgi:hypothetical protein
MLTTLKTNPNLQAATILLHQIARSPAQGERIGPTFLTRTPAPGLGRGAFLVPANVDWRFFNVTGVFS